MLARAAAAALAVALVVVLALRLGDHDACEDARRGVFAAVVGQGERDPGDVETIRDRCRGSEALVAVAGALRTSGDERGALLLVREATAEEPESFAAWRARHALASGAERAEAAERAKALNPRWEPAPAPPAGAAEGP